jgi:hypothetical protein
MRPLKQFVFSVTIFLALTGALCSQTSTTSLQGAVTDPSGSAISGASVGLSSNESKLERTMVTGMEGEYRFLALPPGTYTLTATAKGFSRYLQTDLRLLVNTPATVNVQLKVGAPAEIVTVTGEAPALNLVDASIGNPFNETQVKQIPLEGRNVAELLSLQAGVAYTGNRPDLEKPAVKDQDTRNGSVNGARSDQSNITLVSQGHALMERSAPYKAPTRRTGKFAGLYTPSTSSVGASIGENKVSTPVCRTENTVPPGAPAVRRRGEQALVKDLWGYSSS